MAAAHRAAEQHAEAALRAVVETIVKPLGGTCEFLQIGGAGVQPLRGAREAIDRIDVGGPGCREPGRCRPHASRARRRSGSPVPWRDHALRIREAASSFPARRSVRGGLGRSGARVEERGAVLGAETAMLLRKIVSRGVDRRRAARNGGHGDRRRRGFQEQISSSCFSERIER